MILSIQQNHSIAQTATMALNAIATLNLFQQIQVWTKHIIEYTWVHLFRLVELF